MERRTAAGVTVETMAADFESPVPDNRPRAASFQAPQGDLAVLAGSGNPQFAQGVAQALETRLIPCQARKFSDGNVFVRINENVRGRDTFIIQGVHHPVNDNFMELLFWVDALKRASAQQITAVIPFFSYSKGDKKDEPRVSIRARVCADALEAAGADRILTMDLHSPQIQGFFSVPVDHLYGRNSLCQRVQDQQIPDLVVCSPDAGFAKAASMYARILGVPLAVGHKQRTDHSETAEVLQVIGDVDGANVVLVDDFIITGGSLVATANTLKQRGARSVFAAVTHGVFSTGSIARLEESCIERIFVTDTIEQPIEAVSERFEVVPVAGLFASAIRSIHERTSVSMLFPEDRPLS